MDLACHPDITVILSNTTESGIVHDPDARLADAPAASFPAKLTQLLHHRWHRLGGGAGTGWQIIACDLIDRGGDRLAEILRHHATDRHLGRDFMDWLDREVHCYNTLVDHIVTGHPTSEMADITADIGYDDPCLVATELFDFLAIERPLDKPPLRLPLAEWDENTIEVADIAPWKLRKVAPLMALSLAAWLVFYLGRFTGADRLPPRDEAKVLGRMAELSRLDDGRPPGRMGLVQAFLSEEMFWGKSIDKAGLRAAVAVNFARLTGPASGSGDLGAVIGMA